MPGSGARIQWTLPVAILLFCAPSIASPLVQLQLRSPVDCPSREAIELTLERLVKQPPATPLQVNAHFVRGDDRWVLYVSLENGQRVIAGDSCVAVAEALVVIMALAIDPRASLSADAFRDFERSTAAAATVQPNPLASRHAGGSPPAASKQRDAQWRAYEDAPATYGTVPSRQKKSQDRVGVSLLMLTDVGSLPSSSLGPSMITRYGTFSVWGEVSLSALWPRFAATDADASKGGRIGWFAANVAACAGLGTRLPLAGCLGIESGDLFGYAVNTSYSNVGYAFWSALTAGAVYRGQLRSDWGLELRVGAAVPASRPEFGLDGYGAIFRPGPVSGRMQVGFSWR